MKKAISISDFINGIPKAELHLHIEGSFEPELMFEIAKRNGVEIKYSTVGELKNAYNFNNLQEFLDIYYEGASVLITEQDFYDMTMAYFEKIAGQNVLHTEIFFDPQTHTERNIKFETVIKGISRAQSDAKVKFGISSLLIMCFLRHLPAESAQTVLDEAIKYKDLIYGVGLDSSEFGNPPVKFVEVFKNAIEAGFITVAHAGEEGPCEYIWEALEHLQVSRIDHGNRSLDDSSLIDELVKLQMPLTLCPLSNLKLQVVKDLREHPLKVMLEKEMLVTLNSDDPAYFGGYLNENYHGLAETLDLNPKDIVKLAVNSFKASFLDSSEKERMIQLVKSYSEDYL